MDAIPRNPSYSASFSPLIFLLHYPLLISLYLWLNMYFSKDAVPVPTFESPWIHRGWTPALLPGKSHGWRSLVGCSPWGREESDTTEWLPFHFSLSCSGEGNGNPLQCSCLENPKDGGAWWAAIYGVAQSRTRLKRLSSSSSSKKQQRELDMEQQMFQIRKGVCQGCISSPCLYNLYAEYMMQNAGWDEAQAGIKIARRNINNLICRWQMIWQKVKKS